MSASEAFPEAALRSCAQLGVRLSRFFLTTNIAQQTVTLFKLLPSFGHPAPVNTFRCSTSRIGAGERSGSHRTPRGLHRVAEKIGGGWPVGTVFKSREPVGFTWAGHPCAPITTRILWLEGMEPGYNRGGNVDSQSRYIYIHGTGNELTLGQPDTIGCIHLAADDLIPLYDHIPEGTLVWIAER
jgi:lipoprotein-anchoring transpeptidase ErfK/SrfK